MISKSSPEFSALDPRSYIRLADELAIRPEPEAIRTAGDRAYYAAFLFSRDCLKSKGYITPFYDERDHKYLTESLKRPDILKSLGNEEYRLRRHRNKLTYHTQDVGYPPLQWMISTAKEIIEKVEALPDKS